MTFDDQRHIRHIEQIYKASLEPSFWPEFIKTLCSDIGANSGLIQVRETDSHFPLLTTSSGVAPGTFTAYLEHYYKCDLWAQRVNLFREGDVLSAEQLVTPEEIAVSPFYNEFLCQYAGPYALIGVPLRNGNVDANVTLIRSKKRGPFDTREQRYLHSLMPHFRRAIQIRLTLGNAGTIGSAIDLISENTKVGVVVIGSNKNFIYSNALAEKIFHANDGLFKLRNGIAAKHRVENKALEKLVEQTLGTSSEPNLATGGTIRISRSSGHRPYSLLIYPLKAGDSGLHFSLPSALLIIRDPDIETRTSAQILRQLFQLTAAEAKLAAKFYETTSIQVSAEYLKITPGTARQYLKSIFSKTDTHSQTELVKLLSRINDTELS